MRICYSGHRKESVLTGVRIKRVNFRENIWGFRRDKRHCSNGTGPMNNSFLNSQRCSRQLQLKILFQFVGAFFKQSMQTTKQGHFRNAPSLCFGARQSAKPMMWKWSVILTQRKLTFTRRLLRLASFVSENFTNSELAYSHRRMFSPFINNVNVSATWENKKCNPTLTKCRMTSMISVRTTVA